MKRDAFAKQILDEISKHTITTSLAGVPTSAVTKPRAFNFRQVTDDLGFGWWKRLAAREVIFDLVDQGMIEHVEKDVFKLKAS